MAYFVDPSSGVRDPEEPCKEFERFAMAGRLLSYDVIVVDRES